MAISLMGVLEKTGVTDIDRQIDRYVDTQIHHHISQPVVLDNRHGRIPEHYRNPLKRVQGLQDSRFKV